MKCVLVVLIAAFIHINSQGIKHKIACQDKSLTLSCGKGEHLKIVRGNYGRTNGDVCKRQLNTKCVSQQSLAHMEKKCNDLQTCTLSATSEEFGHHCIGLIKYLEVYYKCIKGKAICSNSEYKCNNQVCIPNTKVCDGWRDCGEGGDEEGCKYEQMYTCEDKRVTINCKRGKTIRVVRGFYGRANETLCPYLGGISTHRQCSANKANEIISNLCNFRQSCTFMANNALFSDPCALVTKYVQVRYQCED